MKNSLSRQHRRTPYLPRPEPAQRRVRLAQRKTLGADRQRHLFGNMEELLAVSPGEVGDGADTPLAPETIVWKRRYRRHVDAGADHAAPFVHGAKRGRDERADRGEQNRGVERLGQGLVGSARPLGAKLAREVLALFVAWAGEGKDAPSLMSRHLRHDMRGRPEAIQADTSRVACGHQRAVADKARAQQGCRLERRVWAGREKQ